MAFGLLRNLASFAASAAGFDDEVDFGFVDETPKSADVMSPQPPLPASAANSWSMLVALGIALSTCGVGIMILTYVFSSKQGEMEYPKPQRRAAPSPVLLSPNAGGGGKGPLAVGEAWEGAATYEWTQSAEAVELRIPLPAATTSRQIAVEFERTGLDVSIQGIAVLSGALTKKVAPDASTWYVERDAGADVLIVSLEKQAVRGGGAEGEAWSCVVLGHPRYGEATPGSARGGSSLGGGGGGGPAIHTIDPNDKDGVSRLVEQLAAARKAKKAL